MTLFCLFMQNTLILGKNECIPSFPQEMNSLNPITAYYLKILEVVSVILPQSEKSLILFSPCNGSLQSISVVFVISPHGGPTTINALISTNGIRLQTRSRLTSVFSTTTSINSIRAVRFTSLSRIPMIGITPSPIRTFITTQIRSIPTEIFMAV